MSKEVDCKLAKNLPGYQRYTQAAKCKWVNTNTGNPTENREEQNHFAELLPGHTVQILG